MKLFPALLALAVIGGPAVAQPQTPYDTTTRHFAVGTCWVSNGILSEAKVKRLIAKNLTKAGLTSAQVGRIVSLPGFIDDVESVIANSGGCVKLIPEKAFPTGKTYSL